MFSFCCLLSSFPCRSGTGGRCCVSIMDRLHPCSSCSTCALYFAFYYYRIIKISLTLIPELSVCLSNTYAFHFAVPALILVGRLSPAACIQFVIEPSINFMIAISANPLYYSSSFIFILKLSQKVRTDECHAGAA